MKRKIEKYDVIQVSNEKLEAWFGCLMIVEEVKDWGIECSMKLPNQGMTYLRLSHDEYVYCGKAIYVTE